MSKTTADPRSARRLRRRARVLLSALASFATLLAGGPSTAGAALDNKGTDFIVSFMPNYTGPVDIELHLTADAPTSVTVDYPVNSPTFTTTVNVNPGAITVVSLPQTASTDWPPDAVQNNAVRMSAAGEFVAYMINRQDFTSDAALALPIDTMNTDYVVSTYDEAFFEAQFVVTAAFDATTVTITPSNAAQGGHPAGVPFNVVLNRGEGFLVAGAAVGTNGGLAGSIVTSDKPVGVTNGNRCTQVPIGTAACDTLMEIAQPTQSWGLEALVVNLPDRPSGSVYRIVASSDATTISLDGAPIGTIDRGDYLEVGPLAGNHVFAGDKPIFVTQYMTGVVSPGATTGDPAMGNMVPTEQYLSSYTFATVGAGQFAVHYVTVIADNADLATILLDGAPIGAGAFSPIPGTNYSGAVVQIAEGTHTTSSTSPHGITVEGLNSADSYLYPGGALFQFINPQGDSNPPLCNVSCSAQTQQCTGTATDDRPSEDLDGNGVLDPGEDLNGNGVIDDDTGIFFVELAPGSTNLSLNVPPFVPGTGTVGFTVDATAAPASGTLVATDGSGNTCSFPIAFAAGPVCGNGVTEPGEQCDDGNVVDGDGCSAQCTLEEQCANLADDDADGLIDCADAADCACAGVVRARPHLRGADLRFRPALDVLQIHLEVDPTTPIAPASEVLGVVLSNANGTIVNLSLPGGALTSPNGKRFKYRDKNARKLGGIGRVQIILRPNGNYRVDMEVYGNFAAATLADMVLQLTLGDDSFANASTWLQTVNGWNMVNP